MQSHYTSSLHLTTMPLARELPLFLIPTVLPVRSSTSRWLPETPFSRDLWLRSLFRFKTNVHPPVPMEIDPPFDPTALGLKEIGNLASWTVSSCKPGCGVEALRDESTDSFWQYVHNHTFQDWTNKQSVGQMVPSPTISTSISLDSCLLFPYASSSISKPTNPTHQHASLF